MLKTERLILRKWKEKDSSDLYEYGKSELVGPNAGWPPHKNEDESRQEIKDLIKNAYSYAIVLKSENKVIGGISLHNRIPDESLSHLNQMEMGYVLSPKYWGLGIAPEAAQCLMLYGFNELNLDLIWCGHFDFNPRSKRVSEKCGFKYRFKAKEYLWLLDDKPVTTLYYNIYKDEYLG
ncbi:MAG: GNAT family N-acetyltransferase [Clostridium sp.]